MMTDQPKKKASRTDLVIPGPVAQAINHGLSEHPQALFHIPFARQMMTKFRYDQMAKEDFETAETDEAVIEHTIEYNRKQLLDGAGMERPRLLIDVIKSLHHVAEHANEMKVLCIGPRSENELFMLMAIGFQPPNIQGLDLLSYSEFVDAGDMHDMPYDDNSFDIIILGWVLGYSQAPERVAKEVMRVAKPGAVIAVGQECTPERRRTPLHGVSLNGYYFQHTDEILALFGDNIYTTYFRHDVHRTMTDRMCHLMVVFELE